MVCSKYLKIFFLNLEDPNLACIIKAKNILINSNHVFNSIYVQSIQDMNIGTPENFFYIEKNNKKTIKDSARYNLYDFNGVRFQKGPPNGHFVGFRNGRPVPAS